jgi:hypothetical protein
MKQEPRLARCRESTAGVVFVLSPASAQVLLHALGVQFEIKSISSTLKAFFHN